MENSNTNLQNQDYYSKASNKIVDFLLGYLGFFLLVALFFLLPYMLIIFPSIAYYYSTIMLLSILILIFLVLWANIKVREKRRYIVRGINFALITIVLIPVLLFGACLISLRGSSGF